MFPKFSGVNSFKMPEHLAQRRQIAYKARIKDIIDGRYVKEEGWQPNYIITTAGKQISRVNIIGIVVLKPNEENVSYQTLVLDDGTGKISIRSFEENGPLKGIDVGDVILLIGKPREYGQEKYIVPEIAKKIEDKRWIELRKLELKMQGIEEPPSKPAAEEKIEAEEIQDGTPTDKIFNLIKEIDTGNGAPIEEVIEKARIKEAEKIIRTMLEEGDVFEIKSGKLKVLE